MYIDSFILTKDPPKPDVDLRDVALGETSDGIFIADHFPADVHFGVYAELAFDPEESGTYVGHLLITPADGSPGVLKVPDSDFEVRMPSARGEWHTRRLHAETFDIEFTIPTESQLLLWLVVGEEAARSKGLVFTRGSHIPPLG